MINKMTSLPPPVNSEDLPFSHHQLRSPLYYSKCVLGGLLSCGLTHTAIVPVDIVKCRMQVSPHLYRNLSSGLHTLFQQQGLKGLTLGWAPTFLGYSLQGMFKFGLYEVFKDVYSGALGTHHASTYKGLVWLSSSASAEFFADIALCPLEMVKVRMQTAPNASDRSVSFRHTLRLMTHSPATYRFPFGSLRPLWSRQIPYTMAKFYFFEKIVQAFYDHLLPLPKDHYGKPTQLSVTFVSGYLSGIICAIVSHPADSLISHLGKDEHKGKSLKKITADVGLRSLFTRGLGTRILMIGTLTGLQWWIYDTFKTCMGVETTGGKSSIKK